MATVIGIRFKKAGKVYYFSPGEVWPRPGENVIVETTRGVELGEVVTGAREVPDEAIVMPLKSVIRKATQADLDTAERNERREAEAFELCVKKIAQHKLEMKLVSVEYTFDDSKIIFYFTANGRVDFRDLVKDLASVFHMRIELRQIGEPDEDFGTVRPPDVLPEVRAGLLRGNAEKAAARRQGNHDARWRGLRDGDQRAEGEGQGARAHG